MVMQIVYDRSRKTVKQLLTTMSLYNFTGEIDDVINKLKEEKKSLLKEYGKGKEVVCKHSYNGDGAYLDGTNKKFVKFEKFIMEDDEEYGDKVIAIYGHRDMDADEVSAMTVESKKQKDDRAERDKKEFERMKKEYGWE